MMALEVEGEREKRLKIKDEEEKVQMLETGKKKIYTNNRS